MSSPAGSNGDPSVPRLNMSLMVAWPQELTMSAPPVATSFLTQITTNGDGTPGEFIVNVGYVGPPPLIGTQEEQQAQVRALQDSGAVLTVVPVARFALNRQRAVELRDVLTQLIEGSELATVSDPTTTGEAR